MGLGLSSLMILTTISNCFESDQKADWRSAALEILAHSQARNPSPPTVIVFSADPSRNLKVETAQYGMGRDWSVLPFDEAKSILNAEPSPTRPEIWFGIGYSLFVFPPTRLVQLALPGVFFHFRAGPNAPYWATHQASPNEACLYIGTIPRTSTSVSASAKGCT